MNDRTEKRLILANLFLWLLAAVIHPMAEVVPTSTGEVPKIFGLLIPMYILGMGMVSTSFLRVALKKKEGK